MTAFGEYSGHDQRNSCHRPKELRQEENNPDPGLPLTGHEPEPEKKQSKKNSDEDVVSLVRLLDRGVAG